jgi:D-glycero-alpha-D-manno-heptose-7-phosphate kinase
MIITRTPFRLTLGGGGTDLPCYYREHGGFILAMGIDKYMYISINTPILDNKIRVRYTKSEMVNDAMEIEHSLAREALLHVGIRNGVEIVSLADVPAGTGLGSSSCYLVGLLNGLHALMGQQVSCEQLAEEACHIELDILKNPIGKQDQYMAAYAGITVLEIAKDGRVEAAKLHVDREIIEALENNLVLFYTGETRSAAAILEHQDRAGRQRTAGVISSLSEIKSIGMVIRDCIVRGNLRRVGELFDEHWQAKKRLSNLISNPQIDAWYELARQHGALGGKISGAGGGGFLMLYCEDRKRELREAMRKAGLQELPFRMEFEGSKVIFDVATRDGCMAHLERQQRSATNAALYASARAPGDSKLHSAATA